MRRDDEPGLAEKSIAAWHNRLGSEEHGAPEHWETAPVDRVPFAQKLLYGVGAFVNNILAAAISGMAIVLNLSLGMSPALVGLLGGLPRITDALTDPLMGYISDNTRSKWGRRRPYIFFGAILVGIIYIALWQLPGGKSESFYFWYFLTGSFVFYLAYTMFATPWVALGYELTPDFHERTRLMGVQNFVGQLAYMVSPWFLAFMTYDAWFENQIDGAKVLAVIIGVAAVSLGVLPAIFLRERFVHAARDPSGPSGIAYQMGNFFKGLLATVSRKSFQKLGLATFLVFNGFQLVASFNIYVLIYYVFGGDQALGAKYAAYVGTLGTVSTFAVIPIVTWMGTRWGKRRAFFFSTGVSIVGYSMKWFVYNPEVPWLVLVPQPLIAFGLGGLFTLMGSMIADVVDEDELETRERREGMYGSIYWWVVKLGMAAALAGGGYLLEATGFDVALAGAQSFRTLTLMRFFDAFVPAVASGVAIFAIWRYPITEQTAHDIRSKLEARRGG
jgi:GPH family glycoside/pentoside/hexuronide:cation symporter